MLINLFLEKIIIVLTFNFKYLKNDDMEDLWQYFMIFKLYNRNRSVDISM